MDDGQILKRDNSGRLVNPNYMPSFENSHRGLCVTIKYDHIKNNYSIEGAIMFV